MIYRYSKMPDAPDAGKVFRFNMFNRLIENLEAFKERFERAHNWTDGKHLFPGAIAFGQLTKDSTGAAPTIGNNFNLSSTAYNGVGDYQVTLGVNVTALTPLMIATGSTAYKMIGRTVHAGGSGANINIRLYNHQTGALTNPATTITIHLAVMENE